MVTEAPPEPRHSFTGRLELQAVTPQSLALRRVWVWGRPTGLATRPCPRGFQRPGSRVFLSGNGPRGPRAEAETDLN